MELRRYLHLNPVRANMTQKPKSPTAVMDLIYRDRRRAMSARILSSGCVTKGIEPQDVTGILLKARWGKNW